MTITPLDMESRVPVEAGTMPDAENQQAGAVVAVPERGEPIDLAALLDDEHAVAQLAATARRQAAEGGLKLLGSDGLLQGITKRIIEAALEAELDEHLELSRVERTGNETIEIARKRADGFSGTGTGLAAT